MKTFEPGKTYQTRSIGDHDCIIRLTVLSRTAKTITADIAGRGKKTLRPAVYDECEYVRPWGNYSMAPTVRADKAV